MDISTLLSIVALALSLAGLAGAVWIGLQVRGLGLGLGPRAGPLAERLGMIGRRLEALEAGQAGLDEALGRSGLHATTVHYAPLGLGGARNCFALALLNREGDGVVLNYLAGTGVRADLKEVRGWLSQGLALTEEEAAAVAANRVWWGVGST
jgi:hypothetical protein